MPYMICSILSNSATLLIYICRLKDLPFNQIILLKLPSGGTEGIVAFSARCSSPWCSHGCFLLFCVEHAAPKLLLITLMVVCYFCPASGAQDTWGTGQGERSLGPEELPARTRRSM